MSVKNKILHSVRTPIFKSKVFKDRKKEYKKTNKNRRRNEDEI